jgi:flagellar protein FlaG
MKIADITADSIRPQQPSRAASELVRVVAENKGATGSPATMDTASFDSDRLKEATKAAEKLTDISNRRVKFEYHEEADVFQVSVVDNEDEVIREIPTDEILKMVANIKKMLGLRIDTKA